MTNIQEQEKLLKVMQIQVEDTGREVVAERLGITVEYLDKAMDNFADMTLTELRFLASATNSIIAFYVTLNAGFPIEDSAVVTDKKEEKSMSE